MFFRAHAKHGRMAGQLEPVSCISRVPNGAERLAATAKPRGSHAFLNSATAFQTDMRRWPAFRHRGAPAILEAKRNSEVLCPLF